MVWFVPVRLFPLKAIRSARFSSFWRTHMMHGKITIPQRWVMAANGRFACGTVPTKSKRFAEQGNTHPTERKWNNTCAQWLKIANILSSPNYSDAVNCQISVFPGDFGNKKALLLGAQKEKLYWYSMKNFKAQPWSFSYEDHNETRFSYFLLQNNKTDNAVRRCLSN